ncbi:preprotein translocase subunit SecE [bacterium]|nr:preprotein translocase subunit SecE [bacterium]MDC0991958.1 preprotein translocase subunit SecE [bacterium]
MSTAIYKKGQGYWTRQMSTIAGSVMILLGAMWISDFFKNTDWFDLDPVYYRAASGVLWVGIFGSLLYYFIWLKPRSVDFLVATESEMKKVNWSSRREVVGSTIVVIALSAGIAGFCKVWDLIFVTFFSAIKVLDTPT